MVGEYVDRQPTTAEQDVVEHFNAGAQVYDQSSRWCTDPELMSRVIAATVPKVTDRVLDVACGTGLVSRSMRPHVASIVGVDLTRLWGADQAAPWLDEFQLASAESLPFEQERF